jgi:hypothetical protein
MSKKAFEMLEAFLDKTESRKIEKIIAAAAVPGLKRTQIEAGN